MDSEDRIIKINIEEEMKTAYIDYSMSVIVSRALPDVRDGLKPVHRRVLYGMMDLGLTSGKPHKKSARIVGEVLGKYHPHGDTSVYDAMVRMAQPWSLRYPLVDGHGNFGSVDGDSPAAMRYTEARLKKVSEEIISDLEKNTVDMAANFDDSLQEPTVMPTKLPVLLINGANGIAVGMATNMPPHNLSDTIDALVAYIDNKQIDDEELINIIKAPDFPTGGIIYGYQGVRDALLTGRGRIVLRAKAEIDITETGRERIIVTEIPYLVNKEELISRIAEYVNEKKIEGISYINDESDKSGMRIVIILKKDAEANVVLNHLYKMSQLQTAFNVNNIALVKGRPKLLKFRELLIAFVEHRHEIVVRRTKYDLAEAEKRAHILNGYLIALDNLDEIIALIKGSGTPDEAKTGLMEKFGLSEDQAKAILLLTLRSLTGMEREKIKKEHEEIMKLITYLTDVLTNESLRMEIIKQELIEIKNKYGDERRTEIVYASEEFNPEDFYADDPMVVTMSHLGYIKRTPLTEFRSQNRGGVGAKGSVTREEDFVEHLFSATMHNTILFFTESGKCYWKKVYEIPEGSRVSKGRAIQNILNLEAGDVIRAFINVVDINDKDSFVMLCTRKGVIKKTPLEAFSRPRQNGIIALNVRENDRLLEAKLTNGSKEIIIAKKSGKALRFHESKIRSMGRTATGVRGVTLANEKDEVVGMIIVDSPQDTIMVFSDKGFGKRSDIEDYRVTNRGGKGVKTINITEKTGLLIGILKVTDADDLMIITRSGMIIRMRVRDFKVIGRVTQGSKLINLREGDTIADVSRIKSEEDENAEIQAGDGSNVNSEIQGDSEAAVVDSVENKEVKSNDSVNSGDDADKNEEIQDETSNS